MTLTLARRVWDSARERKPVTSPTPAVLALGLLAALGCGDDRECRELIVEYYSLPDAGPPGPDRVVVCQKRWE